MFIKHKMAFIIECGFDNGDWRSGMLTPFFYPRMGEKHVLPELMMLRFIPGGE
ncbi:hypothetical protein MUA03_17270 [Enterobacteriaceae bacterium H16N7]|nr:hypothetical protein [Dryocola clanedunensis]